MKTFSFDLLAETVKKQRKAKGMTQAELSEATGMNRSIQSEGTYGEIKANRGYERFRRRGINKAILEIALISCGFNLHKYHLSKLAKANPAKAAG